MPLIGLVLVLLCLSMNNVGAAFSAVRVIRGIGGYERAGMLISCLIAATVAMRAQRRVNHVYSGIRNFGTCV